MAFLAPIAIAAAAIGGVAQTIVSMTSKPKTPDPGPAPKTDDAAKSAQDALMSRRRAILGSGGSTDYASSAYGFSLGAGAGAQKKTLLGQ